MGLISLVPTKDLAKNMEANKVESVQTFGRKVCIMNLLYVAGVLLIILICLENFYGSCILQERIGYGQG